MIKRISVVVFMLFLMAGTLTCQPTSPLLISGMVTDADGAPPATAVLALISTNDNSIIVAQTSTSKDGYYSLEAPGSHDYILLLIPFSGEKVEGYHLHGYTIQMVRLESATGTVTHNFTLIPCHDFIFEGYNADESLVPADNWIGVRFVEDMSGNATFDNFFGIDKGDDSSVVPDVCVPLGQKRRFFVQWIIPDFGNVTLAADNNSAGYIADEPGGTVLNLNHEFARTQIGRLQTNLIAYREEGYTMSSKIADDLDESKALLDYAAKQSGAAQAALSDQATGIALWALEEMELIRAEQDIPLYRMGNLKITVLDTSGNPLPDTTISYKQDTHDFLFGIFDTLENAGTEAYKLIQEAGINYLTSGFYWNETEPTQNKISWDYIDHGIGVIDLADMGFTLKAHALMAFWDFATPDYIKALSFEELNQEVYQHISALVNRYQNQIGIWNVINEANTHTASLGLSREEITTLTMSGIRAIHDNDPGAQIIINNAFDWYGESISLAPRRIGEKDNFTLSLPAYLDQLNADGVEYDIIGQQLYNGGYVSFLSDLGLGNPAGVNTWDLAYLSSILDILGEYGKPVHITEQSVPSSWGSDWEEFGVGWWHRHWDEDTQAEFVHDFYTIAFSKKSVEAITWWNINDNQSFIFTGGLLDKDNKPKPAYNELKDLITDWSSSGQGITDEAGKYTLRGYGGDYKLTVTRNGQSWEDTAHILEQQDTEQTIYINIIQQ